MDGKTTEADNAASSGWQRTIEDMNERARLLSAEGYEVVTLPAGHTAPVAPERGTSDRFGYVHTVPGDDAETLGDLLEAATFSEYEVFRRRGGATSFLVTKFADHEREVAAFVAGSVDLTVADPLLQAARDRGVMYTHLRLLDGTHVASFRHDDPGPLLPEGT